MLRCFYTIGGMCHLSVEQEPGPQVEDDNLHRLSTLSSFCCCSRSHPASTLISYKERFRTSKSWPENHSSEVT